MNLYTKQTHRHRKKNLWGREGRNKLGVGD